MFSFEHDPAQNDHDSHHACDCEECLPPGCMDEEPPPPPPPAWFLRPAAQHAASRVF